MWEKSATDGGAQLAKYFYSEDTTTTKLLANCSAHTKRARQLYKNISMLFLFPVKDSKLSTGVKSMQHLMYHVTVSLQ